MTELERRVYQSRKNDRFKVTTQIKQYTSKIKWKLSNSGGSKDPPNDDLNLASAAFGGLDEDRFIHNSIFNNLNLLILIKLSSSSNDSYSFLTAASQLPNSDTDIQQLLDKAVKCENYRLVYFHMR